MENIMEKICKNCKYWGAYRKSACDRVDVIIGEEMFSIWARVDDDQGLDVELITGPKFGCIHFEEIKKEG